MPTTTDQVQYVGQTTVIPTGDQHAAERMARLEGRHTGIADLARRDWRLVSTVTIPAESTVTIGDVFERVLTD